MRASGLRLCAAAWLLVSCSDPDDGSPVAAERDSAGVRIIENGVGLAATPVRWVLDSQPHVVIGAAADDSTQQLYDVRAAALLADGAVVLANAGSNQLRVYGPNGELTQAIGRNGEGPGEFRNLTDVWVGVDDTLHAWDYQLRRLSVFTPDGDFVRTVQPSARRPQAAFGVLDDGSVIMTEQIETSTPGVGRIAQWEMDLLRHRPGDETPDTLGRHPHSLAVMFETPRGSVGARPLTFAPVTTVDVAGDRAAMLTGRASELRLFDAGDDRTMLVRWRDEPRPVTNAEIEQYERQQLAGISDADTRARILQRLRQEQYADALPTAARVVLERDGHAWVEHWRPDWMQGPQHWTVFDPEGRLRATIQIPEGLRVLDIRGILLVGRVRGEMDVEQVHVHRIERGG